MGIGGTAVERYVEPRVAEAERYVRRQVVGVCDIAVGNGRAVQIDIAHLMVVAGIDATADIPAIQCVEGDIEAHAHIGTPVAVDVFWSCGACTCLLVVGDDVANGVGCGAPAGIDVEAPMALRLGNLHAQAVGDQRRTAHHLEIGGEVGGERRLQTRVTHRDVQWIGIVVDVEQLCDGRLLTLSAELHLQVGLLIEAVAHVQRGRDISNGANGVNRTPQILLDVVRLLRQYGQSDVHIHLVTNIAQLDVGLMVVLGAL